MVGAVSTVPTTPKGRHTRAQLLLAARRVFARDGFVGARMSDIATEAGVSLGGLYRYFVNKENVFESLIEDTHEQLYRASQPVEHHLSTDPYAALLEANQGYLRHYYENRDVMRTLIEAANVEPTFRDFWWKMRSRHTERFTASLRRAPNMRELDELELRLGADAMACMVEQAAYVWYAQEALHDLDAPVEDAARVLTR
ncbi:MAG: hypothetical protein QOK00_842, partial [Thermoleophilaceae bacterium]|nr:hypothetical protein [Thermoleophilaceae bacterium]